MEDILQRAFNHFVLGIFLTGLILGMIILGIGFLVDYMYYHVSIVIR